MEAEGSPPELGLSGLWERCRENPADSAVWEDFFKRFLPGLRGILWRLGVRARPDIDDLLQDLALKVWQLSRSTHRVPTEEAKLRSYFRAMAANAARSWIRRRFGRTRDPRLELPLDDRLRLLANDIGLKIVEREILIRQIEKLLAGPERDHNVFWLYYRQGFTAAAIAAIPAVGLTVKGVEALIHRMTVDLRDKLR